MDFILHGFSKQPYIISAPEKIATPRLLVFRDRVELNIQKMKELLEKLSPGFALASLWPHVKTHKSPWVTQKLKNAGITTFKATPNEVEMLVQAKVRNIFVAYPLLLKDAQKIARLAAENANTRFFVQISHPLHVDYLLNAAKYYGIQWHYFIDLDVGMHRTGIAPQRAIEFYNSLPQTDLLQFAGLHAYDGHNHHVDEEKRRQETRRSMNVLIQTMKRLEKVCFSIPRVVVGGTPSFLTDLEYLSQQNLNTEIILSPGTWVYFDTKSHSMMPDAFSMAACILAQVMDRIDSRTLTLNLGHKRWAMDQGPIEAFSVPGMKAVSWSEEHTVVSIPDGQKVDVGDYVLIAPRHVCSTVNLWEFFTIIGPDGNRETIQSPITARNR